MHGLSGRWFRWGGIVVALVGFGVTRLFVAESIQSSSPLAFLVAGLLPLVLGLLLTVYGVVLAVGTFSREYVNVVAAWCLLGTAGMLAVFLASSTESILQGRGLQVLSESPTLVANVLLGGAVGGVLVGTRSAANRRHRQELRRRGNQALLVNRLLRHEVINAATVVRGYASHLTDGGDVEAAPTDAIREEAQRIVDTIEEVGEVTTEGERTRFDVARGIDTAVDSVREQFPAVTVNYAGPTEGASIANGYRLDVAFRNLLEHAVEVGGADELTVVLSENDEEVVVTVEHDGRPLGDAQAALLFDRQFPEYDDPTSGFRLQIVRLLVTRSDGRIDPTGSERTASGVAITLPRNDALPDVTNAVELTIPNLGRAVVGGLFAGVVMGGYVTLTSDTMSVIGALYGVESLVVGWTTHLFHSVVFAVLFAAGCSHDRLREYVDGLLRLATTGFLWGAILWLVAAGVVMPLWLQFVGVPTELPNFSFPGLVSHGIWGLTLGGSYALLGSNESLQGLFG